MKKYLATTIIILIVFSSQLSCATLSEHQQQDYGLLESAVTFSSDKVIGEYGDSIPTDFSADKFMALVKDKIPEDYYETLEKYDITVTPKGSYYLLLIRKHNDSTIILFDYSCTPEVDGPVELEPQKYDLNNIGMYDSCKDDQAQ
jgi:hypothetical protein